MIDVLFSKHENQRWSAAHRARAVDPVAGHLRERARLAFDAALSTFVTYEVRSATEGPDDAAAYLKFITLHEVADALRCALGWYVAHGDDPAEKLKRYVHDEDLDEALFGEKVDEELDLLGEVAGRV